MCDVHELLDSVRDLSNRTENLCSACNGVQKTLSEARENSYDDVTKSLNKVSKMYAAIDGKLWDAKMMLQDIKVKLQQIIEKSEADGPDMFPELKHGEVR